MLLWPFITFNTQRCFQAIVTMKGLFSLLQLWMWRKETSHPSAWYRFLIGLLIALKTTSVNTSGRYMLPTYQPQSWIPSGHIIRPTSTRALPSTLVISMHWPLNSNGWQLPRGTLSSRLLGGFYWNSYRDVWKPGLMVCSHLPNTRVLDKIFLCSEQAFKIRPICRLSKCSCLLC